MNSGGRGPTLREAERYQLSKTYTGFVRIQPRNMSRLLTVNRWAALSFCARITRERYACSKMVTYLSCSRLLSSDIQLMSSVERARNESKTLATQSNLSQFKPSLAVVKETAYQHGAVRMNQLQTTTSRHYSIADSFPSRTISKRRRCQHYHNQMTSRHKDQRYFPPSSISKENRGQKASIAGCSRSNSFRATMKHRRW